MAPRHDPTEDQVLAGLDEVEELLAGVVDLPAQREDREPLTERPLPAVLRPSRAA